MSQLKFSDVAAITLGLKSLTKLETSDGKQLWPSYKEPDPIDYWGLKFWNDMDESVARIYQEDNGNTYQVSINGAPWQDYTPETQIELQFREYVYWRTKEPFYGAAPKFVCTREICPGAMLASGNIMSLVNGYEPVYALTTEGQFKNMFEGCDALLATPDLPATTLSASCYEGMFMNSKVENVPSLPAMEMAPYCYKNMFTGTDVGRETWCYHVTDTLPATTLAEGCYEAMFSYCIYLADAPVLPATQLASRCYEMMFFGCESLDTVTVAADDWAGGSNSEYWLKRVSRYGKFTSLGAASIPENDSGIPETWLESTHSAANALEIKSSVYASAISYTWENESDRYEYAVGEPGEGYWREYDSGRLVHLAANGTLFIRAIDTNAGPAGHFEAVNNYEWQIPSVRCHGSIAHLVDHDGSVTAPLADYHFDGLFKNCAYLAVAPKLPYETLTPGCYKSMFEGCSRLATGPELPAMTLANNCYESMFASCTSMLRPPVLPAMELAPYCYFFMFKGSGLNDGIILPAETLCDSCYANMFEGCYQLWVGGEICATTLAENSMNYMYCGTPASWIVLRAESWPEGCAAGWLAGHWGDNRIMFLWHDECYEQMQGLGDSGFPDDWTRG